MTSTTRSRGRVLHVLAAYDANEAQGSTIHTIATRLPAEHHLACGTLLDDGDGFATVTETGADLHAFGRRDRAQLAEVVRTVRPDVVHFHGGPLGLSQLATGWLDGTPGVATIYAWTRVGRRTFGSDVPIRALARTPVLAPRTIANTIVPGTAVAAAARRAGIQALTTPDPDVRDLLARQAIPVGLFEGVSPPSPPVQRRPIDGHLLFAGRAELTRGPDLLADAVKRLRSRGRAVTARFCLLGTPDPALVDRLRSVPGCSVTVGGVDLAAEIARSTAVVLPFRHDAATLAPTMVATEAMAAGVPVIATDVRCIRAAVDDRRTGILVPREDVDALASAIERLCGDPELAARLGTAGAREIAARWQRSNVVDLARWAYQFATAGAAPLVPRPPTVAGAPHTRRPSITHPRPLADIRP